MKEGKMWSTQKAPTVGKTYRITDGLYTSRLVKVVSHVAQSNFVVVLFLDAFGKETKQQDAVPVSYLGEP